MHRCAVMYRFAVGAATDHRPRGSISNGATLRRLVYDGRAAQHFIRMYPQQNYVPNHAGTEFEIRECRHSSAWNLCGVSRVWPGIPVRLEGNAYGRTGTHPAVCSSPSRIILAGEPGSSHRELGDDVNAAFALSNVGPCHSEAYSSADAYNIGSGTIGVIPGDEAHAKSVSNGG